MVGWVRKASSHRRQKASVSVQAVIREIVSSTVVDGDDLGIIRSTSTSRARARMDQRSSDSIFKVPFNSYR